MALNGRLQGERGVMKASEHTVRIEDDAIVTAMRLASAAVSLQTRESMAAFLATTAFRNSELVNALISSRSERVTFDLRLVATPRAGALSARIRLYLLCRLDGAEPAEAEKLNVVTRDVLHAHFDDVEFLAVPAEQVPLLLEPFPLNHLFSITRRSGNEDLDTLKSVHRHLRAGFADHDRSASTQGGGGTGTFHVFPFLPAGGSWNVLLRYLASCGQPVCLSIRLRPTVLEEDEEEFLEEQITACERFSQVQVGPATEDLSKLRPTLRRQADLIQRYQQRMLFGLKDNACLMTIEVASPEPLSPQVLDLVGSVVTRPAGGGRESGEDPFHLYLAGGYVVSDLGAEPAGGSAFGRLGMRLTRSKGLPKESRLLHLFDATEASAAFRIPPFVDLDTPGIATRAWKRRPPPADGAGAGLFLGASRQRGNVQEVFLPAEGRELHAYVVGQTGTGKTTLMRSMILNDIRAGEGVCVMDPHGDLFQDILARIPEERMGDVVIVDPTDADFPLGINLLECENQAERYFVAQEMVSIFRKLIVDEYGGSKASDFAGPVFFQQMRMNLLLLMSKKSRPGTLVDFYDLFQTPGHYRKWLPSDFPDPNLERWTKDVLPKLNYQAQGSESISMGMYISSKFETIVFDPRLRNIFGQRRSTVDFRKICDERKILLVNLAKGVLTESNSSFLGMILVAKLVATVLERVHRPKSQRTPFHLYVDEFQSLATQGFVTLLSEARKFGLSLVLANQFLSQVADRRIVEAIFGNVGTTVAFRVGLEDAKLLESLFLPGVDCNDLSRIPNRVAYARTLISGEIVAPFTVETVLRDGEGSSEVAARVRQLSRERYARPRAEVERELIVRED